MQTQAIDNLISREDRLRKVLDEGGWLLGNHPLVRRVADHLYRAAEFECTVLVTGETGTGKEVIARLLHRLGRRAHRPFVPVNSAALTPSLAESQLFGHQAGAFTGARGASLGIFRAADQGMVFLDEIGEMPRELQPKLLRVLQQGEVTPVGGVEPIPVNVQVVAATNRDLEVEVREGRFREDLYFRLNLVELRLPPLRERSDDIVTYVHFFAEKFAQRYGRDPWEPSAETLDRFSRYNWPGNLRQLSQVVQQYYVLGSEPVLPGESASLQRDSRLPCLDLNRLRQLALEQALSITQGHKGRAAKLLGVHPNTLTRMLSEIPELSTE